MSRVSLFADQSVNAQTPRGKTQPASQSASQAPADPAAPPPSPSALPSQPPHRAPRRSASTAALCATPPGKRQRSEAGSGADSAAAVAAASETAVCAASPSAVASAPRHCWSPGSLAATAAAAASVASPLPARASHAPTHGSHRKRHHTASPHAARSVARAGSVGAGSGATGTARAAHRAAAAIERSGVAIALRTEDALRAVVAHAAHRAFAAPTDGGALWCCAAFVVHARWAVGGRKGLCWGAVFRSLRLGGHAAGGGDAGAGAGPTSAAASQLSGFGEGSSSFSFALAAAAAHAQPSGLPLPVFSVDADDVGVEAVGDALALTVAPLPVFLLWTWERASSRAPWRSAGPAMAKTLAAVAATGEAERVAAVLRAYVTLTPVHTLADVARVLATPVPEAAEAAAAAAASGQAAWAVTGAEDADAAQGSFTVLYMGASWCPPCMRVLSHMPALAAGLPAGTRLVKADMDAAPEVFEALGVSKIPTFAVLRNGRCAATAEGVAATLVAKLQNSQAPTVEAFIARHCERVAFAGVGDDLDF